MGLVPPVRGLPKKLEMKNAEFRDIHMGNRVAETQLVPKGWKAEGHVEWQGAAPHPQRKISITAPNGVELEMFRRSCLSTSS